VSRRPKEKPETNGGFGELNIAVAILGLGGGTKGVTAIKRIVSKIGHILENINSQT
jgi:hypothetical protein